MRTGSVISHYHVGQRIGQGGMGDVYRAVDTRLDRPVALKFLASRYVSDPAAKERFIREARAASALDHPNICTIHDIGETKEGDLFIVMALYEGGTLQDRLRTESFSVDRAVHIIRQVAQALNRAHGSGIVHRDVKPANVMVSDDDAVRLLDFGIAKLQSAVTLTATGTTVGTAAYASPEQAGGGEVAAGSDVWSLGVMAYEMLAGRLPFRGAGPLVILHQILNEDPEPLRSVNPAVPRELATVVHQALARDPKERYADAAAFLEALDEATGRGGTAGTASRLAGARGGSPSSRARFVAGGTAAVAVVAVGFLLLRPSGSATPPDGTAGGSANVLAVLPFTANGAPEFDYLSEGLMDLLSGRMDGAGPLRTVDARAVVGLARQEGLDAVDAERGAELATSLGAGRFVVGEVVGMAGRVSISARIHSSRPGSASTPRVTVEGSADSLFTLVDQLAAGLLEASLSGANARIQRNAALSSQSLEATKAFLQGEQFHRRGEFDSASAAYNRAIGLDSTFALAHLMKSMNNTYTYETDDWDAAVRAMRFSGDLPERDQSLIAAFLDHQSGRLEEAERRYVAHLRRWPDEVKAMWQLGRLYSRLGPFQGRPRDRARPYFEQVLEYEPENVPALHSLARLDGPARRYDLLMERAALLERVAPSSEWAVDAWTMAAFALGDSARISSLLESFPRESFLVRIYAAYNALRFSSDPTDAERLLARMSSGPVNPDTGLPQGIDLDTDLFLLVQQLSRLVTGRHEQVRDFLRERSHRDPTWDAWEAELVTSGQVEVSDELLEDVLARLRANTPEGRLATLFEPLHDVFTEDVMALERDVNMARVLGRLGRFEEARVIQERIEAGPTYPAFESLREDAAIGVAADMAFLQGNAEEALALLRTARYQMPSTANSISLTAASHARFLRAELELEYGDPEVAFQFYAGLVESFTPPDKIFLLSGYRRLAELHETAGRIGDAVHYYDKLVGALADADPEFTPLREMAEARLASLQGTD